MKKIVSILLLLIIASSLYANELSLSEILKIFEKNSTNEAKKAVYDKIQNLELENLNTEYYPKLNLVGQAQYQSEAFSLPINIPLITLPKIPLAQYYSAIEVEQLVFDGLSISRSKDIVESKEKINKISNEAEKLKIKENIIKLYFGILIFQKQIDINNTAVNDLNSKLKQFQSMYDNGVLLKTAINQVQIEILRRQEDLIKIQKDISTLKSSLKQICGLENAFFDVSVPQTIDYSQINFDKRPEMLLFTANDELIDKNKSLVNSNYLPKLSVFAKYGYGSPNPNNFMKTGFSTFYNVGIRLKWEIFDWNKNFHSKEILDYNTEIVNYDRINFLRNINSQVIEEQNNIEKYEENLKKDEDIANIQEDIIKESYSQLSNGVITMTDYIINYNNLQRTKLNIEIDKILKLESIYNLQIKTNSELK